MNSTFPSCRTPDSSLNMSLISSSPNSSTFSASCTRRREEVPPTALNARHLRDSQHKASLQRDGDGRDGQKARDATDRESPLHENAWRV
ncbi:hypothetical protein EYF80_040916 [Liparis tanakae]|uniref:Uncharacterized protein n=1 Tax=Liparis tanakae TaxID=230148 RepID=A0A4Z2G7J0_9TELE|nr:hypothetical protein EYF80_040916 [Liparis tanakae]